MEFIENVRKSSDARKYKMYNSNKIPVQQLLSYDMHWVSWGKPRKAHCIAVSVMDMGYP